MVQIIQLLEKTSFSFLSISHLTAIYTEDTLLSQSRIVLHPRHLHPKPVCLVVYLPTPWMWKLPWTNTTTPSTTKGGIHVDTHHGTNGTYFDNGDVNDETNGYTNKSSTFGTNAGTHSFSNGSTKGYTNDPTNFGANGGTCNFPNNCANDGTLDSWCRPQWLLLLASFISTRPDPTRPDPTWRA